MAKKVEKIKEEKPRLIEKEGYIIYHPDNDYYFDEDISETEDIKFAFIYVDIEEAMDVIEDMDYPAEYEIHKVKFTFITEQVLKRKVIYEPEGDI